MLCVLAHIEFLAEILDNFFWNLAIVYSEELNVLATIELDFENTERFFFLLHLVTNGPWLVLHLWISCRWLLNSGVRWLETGTSIPSLSNFRLSTVLLLISDGISWSTLCSR